MTTKDYREVANLTKIQKHHETQQRKQERVAKIVNKSYSLHVLEHNRPIFPKTRIHPVTKQKTAAITRNKQVAIYSNFENNNSLARDETTLRKNIRFCRMHFQFLRLALEIEKRELKIKNSDSALTIDREFYKNFDLEDIREEKNFDTWFKLHKHLYTLKPVELITDAKEAPSDSFLLSIPKSSNIISVRRDIDRLLKDRLSDNVEETEFMFSDRQTPYIQLHIEYNLLVLAYNEVTREVMLEVINDKYIHLKEAHAKKPVSHLDENSKREMIDNVFNHTQSVTRSLRIAKERLHSVAVGVFP